MNNHYVSSSEFFRTAVRRNLYREPLVVLSVLKTFFLLRFRATGAEQNLAGMINKMHSNVSYELIIAEMKGFRRFLLNPDEWQIWSFLGLKAPDDDYVQYYRKLQANTFSLKNRVFILAGGDVPFEEVLF